MEKKVAIAKFKPLLLQLLVLSTVVLLLALLVSSNLYASEKETIGGVAKTITGSFTNLAKLVTALSYLAGMGFALAAIMKFKQHKDNPTQIPVGTPVALIFIAAALLFLPSILGITGDSIFKEAKTGGPTGDKAFGVKEGGGDTN